MHIALISDIEFSESMITGFSNNVSKRWLAFWRGATLIVAGIGTLIWQSTNPQHSFLTNLFQLTGCGVIVFGTLLLVWRLRFLRYLFFGIVIVALGTFLSPARQINLSHLRSRYIENLHTFVGTPYVWGGESRVGVDCSGLARRAWREALFSEGLATFNGRLLRSALHQWWFDASARELAAGAGGVTVPVLGESTISKISSDKLLPGDLAITSSGVHMLVYFGDGQWIEADPTIHSVIILKACCDDNPWLATPVHFYRWAELD